jgi:hypothetical protein
MKKTRLNKNAHYLGCRARDIIRKKYLPTAQLELIEANALSTTQANAEQRQHIHATEVELADENTMNDSDSNEHGRNNQISGHQANNDENRDKVPLTAMTKEQMQMMNEILAMEDIKHERLPPIKDSHKTLEQELNICNEVVKYIPTESINETTRLVYKCALVITRRCGKKVATNRGETKNDPPWKIRLNNKLAELRKDCGHLIQYSKQNLNEKSAKRVKRKYSLKNGNINECIEKVKQRIKATAGKIKRYSDRVDQYRQNMQFANDQHRFYQDLASKKDTTKDYPVEKESILNFWKGIWENEANHNEDAMWIHNNNTRTNSKQEDIKITVENLKAQLKKMPNWKAPGTDQIHTFWYKKIESIHPRLAKQMDDALQTGDCYDEMMQGRTVLIKKDNSKDNAPKNFRPITCLQNIWKILTGIISNEITSYFENEGLLLWEQKGCSRNTRGCKDHLALDKTIVVNCKRRKTNLSVAWIDYKKAYDSVAHSWLIKSMELAGVADNTINFLSKTMKEWKTTIFLNKDMIGNINVKRGIFQGDSLSPLLFIIALRPLSLMLRSEDRGYKLKADLQGINHLLYMDDLKIFARNEKDLTALLNTVKIFSKDINMEFGLEKCATMSLKRGALKNQKPIELFDGETIDPITGDGYKYLGVIEGDNIKHTEMKTRVQKEYFYRLRLLLNSKLNGENLMRAINAWAVPVIIYTAGIVNWSDENLKEIDRGTRKNLTMAGMFQKQSNADRLYADRKDGGRGLANIEECVKRESKNLLDRMKNGTEQWMQYVLEENAIRADGEREQKDFKQNWKEKSLHGQFLRDSEANATEDTWRWLKKSGIKAKTEGLLTAAQEQALPTNHNKCYITKTQRNSKCRICQERDETTNHILSECEMLAGRNYKWRHDRVCKLIHYETCQKYGLQCASKWWDHVPEKVTENDEVKLLFDFDIQVDRDIHHRRPDIIIFNKKKKEVNIIDVGIPADCRIAKKTSEKQQKYQELKIEISRLWNTKTRVTPIIVGALGSIPKGMDKNLKAIDCDHLLPKIQKATVLGSASIIRHVLGVQS